MRAATYAGIATILGASIVSAQRSQHTRASAPPRVAAIAPPPPSPQASPYRGYYRHGAFRHDVPILLMGDGRIFADFGRGWEAVPHPCAASMGYSSPQIVSPSGLQQPVVIQPTVTQPTAPGVERLPYTPPVPAQQTPSQQMAQQGGRLPGMSVAGQSCWARGQDGRIVVTQP